MTDERPVVDEPDEPGSEPIVGPGSGGSPAAPGHPEPDERRAAADDPDVREVIDALRADEPASPGTGFEEAAEQVGTGTDR